MKTYKYTCLKEALSETQGKLIGVSAQVLGVNVEGTHTVLSVKLQSVVRTFETNGVYWDTTDPSKNVVIVYHIPVHSFSTKEVSLLAHMQHAILQAAKQHQDAYTCYVLPKLYPNFGHKTFNLEKLTGLDK